MKNIVCKNKNMLSRKMNANPFSDETMLSRLKKANSIDLKNNFVVENLSNGYKRILPKDSSKRY